MEGLILYVHNKTGQYLRQLSPDQLSAEVKSAMHTARTRTKEIKQKKQAIRQKRREFVAAKQLRTLDVGSGTGLAGLELNALGFTHLDALDYSPQMLAVAAHRGVYKNIIEADLNQMLDIPDDTYDAMICTGTFTHAHVSAKCLDELFRILKPAGHFACTVHNDIWHTEGFEEKTTALSKTGLLKTVNQELGIYYADSTTPEGWYIVWQKQG